MTATALTAEAAGSDLLDELLAVLVRHDGAATPEQIRDLADDVTAVVRRARGWIRRTRQAKPQQATETKPATAPEPVAKPAEPTPAAKAPASPPTHPADPVPQPAARPVAAAAQDRPSPATPASTYPVADPAPAAPRTARRVSTVRYIITAVAVVASTLSDRLGRATTRALHTARPAIQRVIPFAAEHDDEPDEACIVCGPEYGCCSPITSRIGRLAVRLARRSQ